MDKREDLTPVMNLVYLKTLLTDDALDKIKGVIHTKDDKYKTAWDILNKYYENKRVSCEQSSY